MNMSLNDINSIPEQRQVLKLSSRCSVFMKSDCTHRLNKGEADKGDIVLSLSDVMATKVIDFIKRAKNNERQGTSCRRCYTKSVYSSLYP